MKKYLTKEEINFYQKKGALLIKNIFKPGVTSKKRGWGLGLSLSKRLVEEYHKGSLFVMHSEKGIGTTFTIRLLKNLNTTIS